jgi:hypothetical protein
LQEKYICQLSHSAWVKLREVNKHSAFNCEFIADGSINRNALANPGPGSYKPPADKSLHYQSSPSFGLGKAKRSDMANSAKVPGPGVYETPSKAVEGPKFVMGSKLSQGSIFQASVTPGPGTYTYENVQYAKSASYSLKGKYKIGTQIVINPEGKHEKVVANNEMNVPGPGTYQANYKHATTNLSTRFGSEKR